MKLEKKEKKLEEKEKKREEKLKKKWEELDKEDKVTDLFSWVPPKIRWIVNIFLYILIFGGIGYWANNWYQNYLERLEYQRYL
jgi:hypothetical protein